AALALLGGRVAAAGADELARLPAAREVVLRRSRADGIALRVPVDLLPAPELLGVAVAGEDLDQRLPIGVVLRLRELLVERHTGRRVEAPGRAVRDHDRVEAPLRELLEELARRLGRLVAVVGELARVDARGAVEHLPQLLLVLAEVEVTLAVRE